MTVLVLLIHSVITVGVVFVGGVHAVVQEGGFYQFMSSIVLLCAGGCWWAWGARIRESDVRRSSATVMARGKRGWFEIVVKVCGAVLFVAGIDELFSLHEAVKVIWGGRYLTLDDGVLLYGLICLTLGLVLLCLHLFSLEDKHTCALSVDSTVLLGVGACSALVAIAHDTVAWFHWHGIGVILEEMGELLAAMCLGGFALTQLGVVLKMKGGLARGNAAILLCGFWIYGGFSCAASAAPTKHRTVTVIPKELWREKFPICGRLAAIPCYERRDVTSKIRHSFASCLDIQAGLGGDDLDWISPQARDEEWVDVIPYVVMSEASGTHVSASQQPSDPSAVEREVPGSRSTGPRCSIRVTDLYTPFTLVMGDSTEMLLPVVAPVIESIQRGGIRLKGARELCQYGNEREVTLSDARFGKSVEKASLSVNANVPFSDSEECRT